MNRDQKDREMIGKRVFLLFLGLGVLSLILGGWVLYYDFTHGFLVSRGDYIRAFGLGVVIILLGLLAAYVNRSRTE